ncbi:MAG: hypothetical protein U9O87_10625 [Verrucomicrobiota bacterium]|nr:hypothetical protein [Verrucomicrobiota bacterium]
MFETWLLVLKKLNDEKKYKLITVQSQAYLTPLDYDKLLTTIIENKTEFYNNYINELKSVFIRNTLSYNSSSATIDCWLGNLIDFAIDKNKKNFIEKLKLWLSSSFKEPKNCYSHGLDYGLLMILTNDLLQHLGSFIDNPTFYKQVSNVPKSALADMDDTLSQPNVFRQKYLKELYVDELEDDILTAWKNNVKKFIPSPKDVHSANYASHAKWLAIAKEINKKVYTKVLTDWKINHFRRINLWRELKQYGIVKK